jgi:hypothetical protein
MSRADGSRRRAARTGASPRHLAAERVEIAGQLRDQLVHGLVVRAALIYGAQGQWWLTFGPKLWAMPSVTDIQQPCVPWSNRRSADSAASAARRRRPRASSSVAAW